MNLVKHLNETGISCNTSPQISCAMQVSVAISTEQQAVKLCIIDYSQLQEPSIFKQYFSHTFIFYVCGCVCQHVCLYTKCMPGAQRGHK